MLRALRTVAYGIALCLGILSAALLAAIWVLGMTAKAALFGEPKSTIFVKLLERVMERQDEPPNPE